MNDVNETLAHISTARPASTLVFLRHRLDFCCGGRQKLADACRAARLDPQTILAEIAAEEASSPLARWDTKPVPELIAFIVSHYHEALRSDLPGLIEAARRVERVHGNKGSCPHGLTSHLEQLEAEVRQHLDKEEQVLFPALQSGSRGALVHMPIRVMMQEHEDHGASLERLRALTNGFSPPPEACATWRALYVALEKLVSELMQHIHLENNVLFPRALNG